jgi:hypothetical protein
MAHNFTLARADYHGFQKAASSRLRKARGLGTKLFLVQVTSWFFVGLAGASLVQLYQRTPELRFSLGFLGVLLALGVIALVLAPTLSNRLVQRYLISDAGTFLSPQALDVCGEGIALNISDGLSSSSFKWQAFIGRLEDERNHYLFLEPTYGLILPKVALLPNEVELMRERVNEL